LRKQLTALNNIKGLPPPTRVYCSSRVKKHSLNQRARWTRPTTAKFLDARRKLAALVALAILRQ
jgi:hypothetical protein